MKKILLVIFLLISSSVYAQEIPEISTDRPDQSESPDVVPLKHIQFEAGLSFERFEPNPNPVGFTVDNFSTPDLLVRYGLIRNMELRFGTSVTTTKVNLPPLVGSSETEFGPLMIGGKFKLAEEGEILPATSFLAEIEMPALTIKESDSYFNPTIKMCFSNGLSSEAELSYNIGVNFDNEGSETRSTFLYTLSLGLSLSDRVGIYGEVYGFIPFESGGSSTNYIDAGLTYLVKNNLQLDISAGYGLQSNVRHFFIAAGVSARFPN
jgi:hypothetical protein